MIGVGRSVAHVEAPGIRAHPLYRPLNLEDQIPRSSNGGGLSRLRDDVHSDTLLIQLSDERHRGAVMAGLRSSERSWLPPCFDRDRRRPIKRRSSSEADWRAAMRPAVQSY
jgi:hypothetical protein